MKFNTYVYEGQVEVPSDIDEVIISSKIDRIKSCSLSYTKIKTIIIPKNIKEVGDHAFANCKELKTVIFLPGCTTIKSSAFFNCSNLEKVMLPSTLLYIGGSTFEKCEQLVNLELPENIKYIDNFAFSGTNIKKLVLPDSIEQLEHIEQIFQGENVVSEIYFPMSFYGKYSTKNIADTVCIKEDAVKFSQLNSIESWQKFRSRFRVKHKIK